MSLANLFSCEPGRLPLICRRHSYSFFATRNLGNDPQESWRWKLPEPSSATGTLKFPCYHQSNFDSGAIVFILRWQINSEPRAKSCLKDWPPVPVQVGHGPQEPGEFITCQIMLEAAPGIRAVAIFEEICRRTPGLALGVRRTLERRIARWRALNGPNRDVIFRQGHPPGANGPVRLHRHGRAQRHDRR